MRALLDTHVVLWWLGAAERLTATVRALLEDPASEILVSSVSSAEIAIKHSLGRLVLPGAPSSLVTGLFREDGFVPLPFEHAHAFELARLPLHHRDPFDRMLVAQARVEDVPLVTTDAKLGAYEVHLVW